MVAKHAEVTGSRMLWFAQASVGLAGILGKILFALKKLFFSTIFPDFRHIHISTQFIYIIYIWGSLPGLENALKKTNVNLWIISLNLPHVGHVVCRPTVI